MQNSRLIAFVLALVTAYATPVDGLFSKTQTERGKRVYHDNCAVCHGDQLEGGEHAPPLNDDAFWAEWSGKSVRSLYSRVISTMPPTDPGSLPEKDVIDIVAHLARENGVPEASKTILHADELNNLKLERPK